MSLLSAVGNVNEWTRRAASQLNPLIASLGPISQASKTGKAGQAIVINSSEDGFEFRPGGGSGTVTSVSVTTANGVSGTVSGASTTPAITLSLGAITPTSLAASGTVTGSNLSGTNTGDQTIALTGDVTGGGTGSFGATIAAGAVSLSKMANVATGTVFYRKTAATGAPEVQTLATLKTDLNLSGTNTGDQTTISGNAGSATVLQTPRAINGVNFDGSAAITINAVDSTARAAAATAISTTAPLTGGGDLSANRTLAITAASGTAAGSMSSADFSKLAAITGTNTGDQTITLTGDVTGGGTGSFAATVAAGAVTLAKMASVATGTVFYRKTAATGAPEVQTLATLKTDLAITKSDVGLSNADNTSDVNKPVSTAQQAALDLKAPINNAAFTGTFSVPASISMGGRASVFYGDATNTAVRAANAGATYFQNVDGTTNWGRINSAQIDLYGNVVLQNNSKGYLFTDASGSNPSLVCQADNNVVFYNTDATGAQRPIWGSVGRSSGSAFTINVPCQISGNLVNIGNISTQGAAGGFSFVARSSGPTGTFYNDDGTLRYNNGAERFTFGASGDFAATGNISTKGSTGGLSFVARSSGATGTFYNDDGTLRYNNGLERYTFGASGDFTASGAISASNFTSAQGQGATFDGTTDDTVNLQKVFTTTRANGGGVIHFPYNKTVVISQSILVGSNTVVYLNGCTVKASGSFVGTNAGLNCFLFRNYNYSASVLTDTDIQVIGPGTFDYGSTVIAGGGAHAVAMRHVDRVTVRDVRAFKGENATAFLGCRDTLVDNCVASNQINCYFDHWDSAGTARVINCSGRNDAGVYTQQGIQFTGDGSSGVGNSADCVVAFCTLEGVRSSGGTASAIITNSLAATSNTYHFRTFGNRVKNSDYGLVFDGAGGQNLSSGDTFIGVDKLPIFIKSNTSGSPSNCKVVNPHLIDCNHTAGNVAMISMTGASNEIRGLKVTNSGAAPYALIGYVTGTDCVIEVSAAPSGTSGRYNDSGTRTRIIEPATTGYVAANAPTVVSTGTYTIGSVGQDFVFTATCTVTLPASPYPGQRVFLRTTVGAVTSAASNVVPLAGGAAGTAILPATAGKWVTLVWDTANWQTMAGN